MWQHSSRGWDYINYKGTNYRQNPLIVSSFYQTVTILWLFKYPFSLRQAESHFGKTQMQSHLLSCLKQFNGILYPPNKISMEAVQLRPGGPLMLPEPLLRPAHPVTPNATLPPPWRPFGSLNASSSPSPFFEQKPLLFLVNLSKYFVLQIPI